MSEVDQILTPDEAYRFQVELIHLGELPIWTVCFNPSDYPGKFTARPHGLRPCGPFNCVLVADDLLELRDMLPPGLTRLSREVNDDPVIVECWV